MKRLLLIFHALILFHSELAAQDFIWAKTMGGVQNDFIQDIVTDHLGNIYVVGSYEDTADFDPGPGQTIIYTAEDITGLFIQKFDPNGDLIWVKGISKIQHWAESFSIAVDHSQNVYVAAAGLMNCDFDPGPGVFLMPDQVGYNPFILKLAPNGDFIWAKALEGSSSDQIFSLKVDDTGNIYLTGVFSDSLGVDVGTGTDYLFTHGDRDCFIIKYDSSLALQWSYAIGGAGEDEGNTIVLHNSGVFVTGNFSASCDFDPSQSSYILNGSGKFVLKLGADGSFNWVKGINGMSSHRLGDNFIFDRSGDMYLTGMYTGYVDLDPGLGFDTAYCGIGSSDACIVKLDGTGNYIWGKKIISAGFYTSGISIAADALGGLYIVGIFDGATDFDPGAGGYVMSAPLTSVQSFYLKLDSSGSFVSVYTFDGGDHIAYSITTDSFNNIYSAGYFTTTVDFDVNSTIQNSASFGYGDAYILKMASTLRSPVYETTLTTNVNVYPNPTNKTISISSDQPIKDIIIRDIVGKIVQHHTSLDTKQITLDIETAGVHLISITDKKGNNVTKKVVVNN